MRIRIRDIRFVFVFDNIRIRIRIRIKMWKKVLSEFVSMRIRSVSIHTETHEADSSPTEICQQKNNGWGLLPKL